MHIHFRDAVPSCPLGECIGSPTSFQIFITVCALSSHKVLHTPDEKQQLKICDGTLAFLFFMPFNIQLFPLPASLTFPSLAYLPYDKCILYLMVASSLWEPAKCCGAGLVLD